MFGRTQDDPSDPPRVRVHRFKLEARKVAIPVRLEDAHDAIQPRHSQAGSKQYRCCAVMLRVDEEEAEHDGAMGAERQRLSSADEVGRNRRRTSLR